MIRKKEAARPGGQCGHEKKLTEPSLLESATAVNTFGWFRAMRSPDALELIKANPLAFVLAYFIAARARWRDGFRADGVALGEAFLGDWKEMGMSEQNYRTAKRQLAEWGFATFKPTSKGTVAKLIGTRLFSVLAVEGNDQSNGRLTSSQRTANGRLTDGSRLTKIKRAKDLKTKRAREKKKPAAQATRGDALSVSKPRDIEEVSDYAESKGFEDYEEAVRAWWNLNEQRGWRLKDWRRAFDGYFANCVREDKSDLARAIDAAR